jgi:hypothetical protein
MAMDRRDFLKSAAGLTAAAAATALVPADAAAQTPGRLCHCAGAGKG